MRQLFNTLKTEFENNKEFILCTIVSSMGSAPRGAGARMLVGINGVVSGSVGGGTFEYRVANQAMKLLETSAAITPCSCLHHQELEEAGMICGGKTSMVFTYLSPRNAEDFKLVNDICEAFEKKEETYLLIQMNEEEPDFGRIKIYSPENLRTLFPGHIPNFSEIVESGEKKYYIEKLVSNEYVYIFGAGHVARELVPLLYKAGFDCVVWDDREDFSDSEIFTDALRTVCCPIEKITSEIIPNVPITSNDYVCIMTRGHLLDLCVEEKMLRTPAGYIGVMGSKNKTKYINNELKKKGFSKKDLARITTPIGLDIHGNTPFEIALSIAGQLIKIREEKK